MTGQLDILDAVSKAVSTALPQLKRVYIDLAPGDCARPAVLVQSITSTVDSAGCGTVRVTAYFTVTLFDETDDYSNSSTQRLLDMQQRITDLFRAGYLEVNGRSLAVTASTGGRDWDKAYVDIQFTYYDDRSDEKDTTPLMGSVETTLKE